MESTKWKYFKHRIEDEKLKVWARQESTDVIRYCTWSWIDLKK